MKDAGVWPSLTKGINTNWGFLCSTCILTLKAFYNTHANGLNHYIIVHSVCACVCVHKYTVYTNRYVPVLVCSVYVSI